MVETMRDREKWYSDFLAETLCDGCCEGGLKVRPHPDGKKGKLTRICETIDEMAERIEASGLVCSKCGWFSGPGSDRDCERGTDEGSRQAPLSEDDEYQREIRAGYVEVWLRNDFGGGGAGETWAEHRERMCLGNPVVQDGLRAWKDPRTPEEKEQDLAGDLHEVVAARIAAVTDNRAHPEKMWPWLADPKHPRNLPENHPKHPNNWDWTYLQHLGVDDEEG